MAPVYMPPGAGEVEAGGHPWLYSKLLRPAWATGDMLRQTQQTKETKEKVSTIKTKVKIICCLFSRTAATAV